ncbi:MAG: hypothetical protein RI894_2223, partial [Bacteroidota bacterium]
MNLLEAKLIRLWRVVFAPESIYKLTDFRAQVQGAHIKDLKPLRLAEFLSDFAPDFAHERRMTFAQAYLHTFQVKRVVNQVKAETELYAVMSVVYKHTETYIIQTAALHESRIRPNTALLELYTHQSLKDCFEDYWRTTAPLRETPAERGFKYLHNRFEIAQSYMDYQLAIEAADKIDWHHIDVSLEQSVVAYQLRRFASMYFYQIDFQASINTDTINNYINSILQYDKTVFETEPLVSTYFQIVKALLTENMAEKANYCDAVLIILRDNAVLFSHGELHELYTITSNIANILLKENKMNNINLGRMYQIYRGLEENSVLLRKGQIMDLILYKNIVTISLGINEITYALEITERYKQQFVLATKQLRETADAVYAYNRANIAFHQKKYEEVENVLRLLNPSQNTFLELDTEVLILKAYFEQDLLDLRGKYIETPARPNSFLLRLEQFQQRVIREKSAHTNRYQHFAVLLL